MENKREDTRPDTRRKSLRGIIRFIFLFLLVVLLVWIVLTIVVWIHLGPTTSEDPDGLQTYTTFNQDILKPLEEKYEFELPVFLRLTDDGVFELGLYITEQDRMIELMREIHALKTRSQVIDKMAVDVKISCVSPRQGQTLRFQTTFLIIRTVMPGESGYTGKPARTTDVRIWNGRGEKFFPQDKLFGPDGATDEIETFIRSLLDVPAEEKRDWKPEIEAR